MDDVLERARKRVVSKVEAAKTAERSVKSGDICHPILRERWLSRAAVWREEAADLAVLIEAAQALREAGK